MAHSSLAPVFRGLRMGLHLLCITLLVMVAALGLLHGAAHPGAVLLLVVLFALVYALGAVVVRASARRPALGPAWLVVLSAIWAGLLVMVPEAAYLVFPLFFLYLHVLPRAGAVLAVAAVTVAAVLVPAARTHLTLGGAVGPLVGAGVALLIDLGYRALAREAREREELLAELLATRDLLAATEREQGVLAERSRLAREIHDTVAQDLSSIQMLLHAAEQADPARPGVEHVRLARETAASGLADARRFIRELAPADLERGLGPALERLARATAERTGLEVRTRVDDGLDLPVAVQVALLRVTQGALANVVQHAGAARAEVAVAVEGGAVRLVVADDGRGFDPDADAGGGAVGRADSFGLRAIAQRAAELGGTLAVDSAPGSGTRIIVRAPLRAPTREETRA